jgi:ribosomal protein S18 acetylase RimI-like enzyme
MKLARKELVFKPVTTTEWPDLQRLFGPQGADGGCWCMWWRIKRSEFARRRGEQNRQAMEAIIRSGEIPGILAYLGTEPIGWCSVAPRQAFPVLDRSAVLKRVDDQPVWSIVCFYISAAYRGQGLCDLMIEAALDYARKQGARIVEAYPVDPETSEVRVEEAYTGLIGSFRKAGFREAARRSRRRVIMRYRY